MIFKYSLTTAFIISFLLLGCDSFGTQQEDPVEFERRELPRQLTEQETELVNGSGNFGFTLMQQLVDEAPKQSHFISPLSIQMAYGMAMNGAEGETYTQMHQTLGMEGISREQVNESAKELIELLTQFDDNVQFNIANSIWYRDTFSVEQDFLDINNTYYNAEIEAADFSDAETVDRINNWVNDQTESLIEKIVQGPIDPQMVMYLINAMYFNGDWTRPFDTENTKNKPFYLPDGSTAEAKMMQLDQQEQMLYRRGENYRAVNLYYGDAGFAMTLVLPDEDISLEKWLAEMDWSKWTTLTDGFNRVTLTLDIPKFEMEYEIKDFKETLKAMGITNAFNPGRSDFSRINSDRGEDLYISDTRHKSFIKVNEKGTEAAAATSIGIRLVSAPQAVEINFDRPFFYVIREVESESILFMGTMTNPSH